MMSFRRLLTFLLLLTLFACGGGGGGSNNPESDSDNGEGSPPPPAQTTLTGTVRAPGGVITQLDNTTPLEWAVALLIPRAFADITGLAPVSDATVELVRLDQNGSILNIVATTTTDSSGVYRIETNETPSPLLMVRAVAGNAFFFNLAVSTTTNIDPGTTLAVQKILDEVTLSGHLTNFSEEEIVTLLDYVKTQDIDLSSASTTVESLEQLDEFVGTRLAELARAISNEGDNIPEPFEFVDQTNVVPGTVVISNFVTVAGLDSPTPIYVAGGEYALDDGVFTSSEGLIENGQTVNVKLAASESFESTTALTLTIGSVSDTFYVTTVSAPADDAVPDQFTFTDQLGAARETLITSAPINVTGINTSAPISITGGEYSIDGRAFTSDSGLVNNNQQVTVRQTSSSDFATTTDTTLTIGGVNDTFSVTTENQILPPVDSVPDPFSFLSLTDVSLQTSYVSNAITVTGINSTSPIRVTNGEYAINGGPYTANDGLVSNGDTVTVRQTSSTGFSTITNTTLTIGGVSGVFSLTTIAADIEPDAFSFAPQEGVPVNEGIISNPVQITGINTSAPISISGGSYSIDGGLFTTGSSTVANRQTVRVKLASSSDFSTPISAILTIGNTVGTFTVSTQAADTTPNEFIFIDLTEVDLSTVITSNSITVTGLNTSTTISILGGEYSLDGGPFTNVAGTVVNGQTIIVRQTSSADFQTATETTLTIGTITDIFSVTTRPADIEPAPFSFAELLNVIRDSLQTSNTVVVSGIDAASPISIVGGEYSIDGGGFTAAAGVISNGQPVTVRHTSSVEFSTATDTVVTIGGVESVFRSTTEAEDTTPDEFSFASQTDVALNHLVDSNSIIISGINSAADITINGGEYSIDGGDFTSNSGTVRSGQSVVVRVTSPNELGATVEALMTIGGISKGFSVTTVFTDSAAPTAKINFPPAYSYSDGETITVRGTASDDASAISRLSVAGIDATTDDGFRTWSVNVPLSLGINHLTVETTDVAGNNDNAAAEAMIERREVRLISPENITVEATNNRALVADFSLRAVVSVDLSTGERTVLSNNGQPDISTPFSSPRDIVLDSANNRAFVTDAKLQAILSVDLTTGARTILSDNSVPDSDNAFETPHSIVLDSTNNRLLVGDAGTKAIMAVNLNTGARTILSDQNTPDSTNPFSAIGGMSLDSANNRVLVVNAITLGAGVFMVDLTTGARTILSSNSIPNDNNKFSLPDDIVVDSARNRALVVDHYNRVLAVDLTSGVRTIFSPAGTPDIHRAISITLDSPRNRALVTDLAGNVFAVDLTTGSRTVLSAGKSPDKIGRSFAFVDIAFDKNRNRALVVDQMIDSVLAVDPDTGVRTVLSDNSTPDGGSPFGNPYGIAVNDDDNQALVVDTTLDALLAVDLDNGTRRLLSDNSVPDGNNAFGSPHSVTLDKENNQALVADVGARAIIAVDLLSGAREILSDSGIPDADSPLLFPKAVTLDRDNNRVLVLDNNDTLKAVNLSTGARVILSDAVTPDTNNALQDSGRVTLDYEHNRALITDLGLDAIVAVDLTTGARQIISGISTPNGSNTFVYPFGLALDSTNNRLLVVDSGLDAVLAVDMINGQRVILSDY